MEFDTTGMSENKIKWLTTIYDRIEELEQKLQLYNKPDDCNIFGSPQLRPCDEKRFKELLKINYKWLRAIDRNPMVRQ